MNKLKDLWLGMDMVNRVLLIAALAASVWSLIMGQGLYGVLLMVVMGFLMITRSRNSIMRRSRLFGTMYFPMPDGELVPRAFEQVKTEYVHGAQSSYDGRTVELRFPWWYLNTANEIDTGFGLKLCLKADEALLDEARRMRRGDNVRVVGTLVAARRDYFFIGKLEALHRISDKELYPLKHQ